ncbi:unnamed protein product, partial [Symbiodinium sp. CCMP2592]
SPDLLKPRHVEGTESQDPGFLKCICEAATWVGYALPLACIPRLQACWSPFVGVRVGEASHPGPKGSEGKSGFNLDVGSLLGPDFAATIRSFIEAAVQKAIQEALQGLSLGGKGGHDPEQPGPKRRKRHHGKGAAAAAGEDSGGHSGAPAAPTDPGSSNAKGKAKGGDKGVGNTPTSGTAGKGRGKDAGKPIESGRGRGKGDSAHGKGQPTGASAPDDEWKTVSRHKPQAPWRLRSSDWTAPAVIFDEVAGQLEGSTGTYKAVVLCGPGQADLLATLLLGSKRPHGVIAVTPDDPEASARCPGEAGNQCAFRQVRYHHISTPGVDLPGPKVAAAKAQKVVAAKTVVLYARIYKKFVPKATWKDVLVSPQRAFHCWIAQQHLKVQDSWGWAKEQAQGEDHKVYGLFRVPEAEVTAFVAMSGRDGFFIDPPRWTPFPSFLVQWAEKEPKETDLDFLQRVRTIEAPLGIVVGRRGLGKRIPRDASQAIARTWMLEHAPFDWSAAQALEAVSTIFTEVTMTRQQRTRKGINFFFRAEHATDHDVVALPFEDGTNTEILWCRWAPVRARPQAQTIRTNGSWSLLPPKDPFSDTTKTAQVAPQLQDDDEEAGDAEVSTTPASEAAKETKEVTDKETKRELNYNRLPPMAIAFSMLPLQLFKAAPEPHNVLRAKVAQHFKKHADRYELTWDKELPNKTVGESFQKYIDAISVVDTWAGHLELAALGRIFDVKFVIYPTSPELAVCAVHAQQRKRVVALAFNGSHYEWLRPTGKLPQELCDVATAPPKVPMRGGGKALSNVPSATGSRRTAWTSNSEVGSARSVWTPAETIVSSCQASVWTAGSNKGSGFSSAVSVQPAASSAPALGSEELDDHVCPEATKLPTDRQIKYWGRAGWRVGRNTEVVCPLCPFRAVAKNAGARKSILYGHYKTHHPGKVPSGVVHGARQPTLIKRSKGTALHWKCPLCTFGIAARDAFAKGADAVTADKRAHCTQAHPETSWSRFKAMDRAQVIDKAAVTRRGRECLRRLSTAKGTELEGFRLFCWPYATPAKTFAITAGIRSGFGWMCLSCFGPYRSPKDAIAHVQKGNCQRDLARSKAKRRIAAIDKLAKVHSKRAPAGAKKQRESNLLQQAREIFQLPLSSD